MNRGLTKTPRAHGILESVSKGEKKGGKNDGVARKKNLGENLREGGRKNGIGMTGYAEIL